MKRLLFTLLLFMPLKCWAGTVFFQDSFVDTDSTTLENHTATNLASPYSANSGTWSYISGANRAYITPTPGVRSGASGGQYVASGVPATADYDVYATLELNDFNNTAAPAGRVSKGTGATATGYFLVPGKNSWILDSYVNGAAVARITWVVSINTATISSMQVDLRFVGQVISLYTSTGTWAFRGSYNDAGLIPGPGSVGIGTADSSGGLCDSCGIQVSSIQGVNYTPLNFSVSSAAVLSGSTNTITLTGVNTNWSSGTDTPTFVLTGGFGADIITQSVLFPTSATVQVFAGTAPAALSLFDPASGTTDTIQVVSVLTSSSSIYWSPYNWYQNANNYAQSLYEGAYYHLNFSGTNIGMAVDVTPLVNDAVPAGSFPVIQYSIDDGAWTNHEMTANDSIIQMGSGLAVGTHTVTAYLETITSAYDRWLTPSNVWRINGFDLDQGATTTYYVSRSSVAFFFGDSLTAAINSPVHGQADSWEGYAPFLASGLNSEYSQLGLSHQGWYFGGFGNIPPFNGYSSGASSETWNQYYNGVSSLVGGKFPIIPNYIFVNEGTNDSLNNVNTSSVTNAVSNFLTNARLASDTTTWIFIIVPFGGWDRAAVTAGFNNYQTATPDNYAKLLDLGSGEAQTGLTSPSQVPSKESGDGLHPNVSTHAMEATRLMNLVYPLINGSGGGGGGGGSCGSITSSPGSGTIRFN